MQFVIHRDTIHPRTWTVYRYRPGVSAVVIEPHQRGFKRKRDAAEYVARVLTTEV